MDVLNLTEGFAPYENGTGAVIPYEFFTFKGGEPHIRLKAHIHDPVTITTRISSFNDLGKLCVAVDAIRRWTRNADIWLLVPYFPAARQDRVCNEGEALTVKVYADIINSLGLASVRIFDPHSDVAPALIDNCDVVDNHLFVRKCVEDILTVHKDTSKEEDRFFNFISPDAGANKKMISLMEHFSTVSITIQNKKLIKCDKTRDLSTGEITGFEVNADVKDIEGKDCIIVDDICDGGGTFIGLAEKLKEKNAGDLYLIVSHGIFSKGFEELEKHFKHIYCTDSFDNTGYGGYTAGFTSARTIEEVVTQIKFSDGILG